MADRDIDAVADFNPAQYDRFEAVNDSCPNQTTVVIQHQGETRDILLVHCELERGHADICQATIGWVPKPDADEVTATPT
jgi:hypothetical protein